MRLRSKTEGTHPGVATIEHAWDKTVTPHRIATSARSVYDDQSAYYTWSPPSSPANLAVAEEEYFEDNFGTDGKFRPCFHRYRKNEYPLEYKTHRFFGSCGGNAYARAVVSALDYVPMVALQSVPDIDWTEMANEACSFMVPRLNEGTSVINSLIELKDIKRMNPFPSIERLKGRHTALKHMDGRLNPAGRKAFQRELVTRMNDAHLNASFGIVPLLTDIFTIHDELVDLATKLERLKRSVGKRLQRHYKRVLPISDGVFTDRNWVQSDRLAQWFSNVRFDWRTAGSQRSWVTLHRRSRWIRRPVYHATMRYSYTLPKMDSELETVYAALDTLGVRLDPTIIWNAIRFSFIIDWVVDVSSFLQKTARDNYPINTQIHEFCHSLGWHKEMELLASYGDDTTVSFVNNASFPATYGGHKTVRVSRHVVQEYDRRLANPDYSSIAFRALKYRQAALAGSLLLSRTRWGNMRRYQRDALPPSSRGVSGFVR